MTDAHTEHETIDEELLATLAGFDTPTICNALEIAAPQRPRSTGYTRQTLIAADPNLPPMVGYARTATIRAVVGLSAEEKRRKSLEYYEYTAQGPGPTIVVVQDVDAQPGVAAWWGEVHTALHQGLGSLGAMTNGAIRDLDQCADGFQLLGGSLSRSHSYVHVAGVGCEVDIVGMVVEHGSLIHADKHGAVGRADDSIVDNRPGHLLAAAVVWALSTERSSVGSVAASRKRVGLSVSFRYVKGWLALK